jgi:hypothetical protein
VVGEVVSAFFIEEPVAALVVAALSSSVGSCSGEAASPASS